MDMNSLNIIFDGLKMIELFLCTFPIIKRYTTLQTCTHPDKKYEIKEDDVYFIFLILSSILFSFFCYGIDGVHLKFTA